MRKLLAGMAAVSVCMSGFVLNFVNTSVSDVVYADVQEKTDASETAERVSGDIDGDGVVSVSDLVSLSGYVLMDDISVNSAADVNQDGIVNIMDVMRIKKIILNPETSTVDKVEEPASPEEFEEVTALYEKYKKAVNDKDYETLVDITDIDLICVISEGEEKDRDTYISMLKGENDDTAVTVPSANSEAAFGELRCCNSEAKSYNDFLSDPVMLENCDASEKYKIDGMYVFRMASSTTVDPDDNNSDVDGDFNLNIDMYIFRINGKWKVDCGYGMLVDFIKIFGNIDTDE